MLELRQAADLYDVERAYREPLLKRMNGCITPGETERIWGLQSFFRKRLTK